MTAKASCRHVYSPTVRTVRAHAGTACVWVQPPGVCKGMLQPGEAQAYGITLPGEKHTNRKELSSGKKHWTSSCSSWWLGQNTGNLRASAGSVRSRPHCEVKIAVRQITRAVWFSSAYRSHSHTILYSIK